MTQPAPSFPAFDEWQSMSEREQDALLDRLETVKRRRLLAKSTVLAVVGVAACVATAWVLLMLRQ